MSLFISSLYSELAIIVLAILWELLPSSIPMVNLIEVSVLFG